MEEIFSVLHAVLYPLLITWENRTGMAGVVPGAGITCDLSTFRHAAESLSPRLWRTGTGIFRPTVINTLSTTGIHFAIELRA